MERRGAAGLITFLMGSPDAGHRPDRGALKLGHLQLGREHAGGRRLCGAQS